MQQTKCYIIDLPNLRKEVLSREMAIKAAGITAVLLAIPATAFAASTGIDAGADQIYKKLLKVGKWVIVIKGGIDTIKSVADGDLQSARKNFLGYMVTYAILWALPWGMHEIDKLFEGMEHS